MAEKTIINDMKICEKQKDIESFDSKKNNNSLEKIDSQYKSDQSENISTNLKTINTEMENKSNLKMEEHIENKNNLLPGTNTTSKKSAVLQEKLKKIFMVREKGKYEYNKQEIPEKLKYHSDSDSSEISELRNSKRQKQTNNHNNSRNNNNQVTPKISVKRHNSGYSKKELSLGNNNIKKEKNINEKKSDEENNSPNLPKNNNSDKNIEITPIIVDKNNNKEKKFNNFNKKILDNYINEMNNNEKKEKEEKKQPKSTAIKDIIEKLKAKKIEKEELGKKEKEAEEESIMQRKIKYKEKKEKENENKKNEENKKNKELQDIKDKDKNNEKEKEKEKDKEREINDITKRIKERKMAREKMRKEEEARKKEEEEKNRIEEEQKRKEVQRKKEEQRRKKELEEEKKIREEKRKNKNEISKERNRHNKRSIDNKLDNVLPHKVFRDENDEEELNFFKKKSNVLSPKPNNSKKKINSKEKNIRRKQLELDLKEELSKDEIEKYNKKSHQMTNKNKYIIEKNNESNNIAYKKPINKISNNSKALNVYRPKRPGAARGRSQEKVGPPNLLLNKINSDIFNNSSNNIYSTINNNNNLNNSNNARITYTKKRSPMKENKNFVQLNNSFCGYNNNISSANNNSMIARGNGNVSSLEINNINNLNSSFDSLMRNYGTNNNLLYNMNLNNSFYNNGKSNTNLYNGRITHTTFINPDTISNLNINNFNTNNSIIQNMRHQQLLNYEPNSSFSFGYNNNLASNILNNSFLGINVLNNSFQRNNNYSSINIEDLLVLEEKLNEIIITLNKTKIMYNECFEFWNYYYNCSLYGRLEKLFTNIYESNNVKLSINYLLMIIIICYDFSFDMNILNDAYSVLDELLKLNHQNLIIIFEHILTKISSDSRDNIWVFKLHGIVNSSKNSLRTDKYSSINDYSMSPVDKIIYNTGIIIQNIRVLLKNYKSPKIDHLTSIFKKINEKSYEDINAFFREYILRVDNMNGSVLASIFLKENNNFKTEPAPYLKTINRKPYSLILDLDETLVHFKVNPENETEGVLRVRPGIIEFLDSIDQYYELIIFTAATQEYADLLIDAVEENKIYFEHRLYRQHTVIIDNDFVKDLSRVGRPLDKIAIVDNMPQNFRLQKENGINIKAFWGEEVYDTALIDLAPILINIAQEGGDIRDGLGKYRDEIVKKVTSNISKHTPS